MTMDNFLSFLQQLLTMVDKKDPQSIALAKASLIAVTGLARSSRKVDAITVRSMVIAERQFDYLVMEKEDFAGVKGAYQENKIKRQRLANVIMPGC